MQNIFIIAALLGLVGLTACDKPTTVNVPADTVVVPVPVPGPAGEKGVPGPTGDDGIQGEPGKTGDTEIHTEEMKPTGDADINTVPPAVNPAPPATTPAN